MGERLSKNEINELIASYESQLKKLQWQISATRSAIEDLKKLNTEKKPTRVSKATRSAASTTTEKTTPKKKRGRPPKTTSAPLASNEAVAKKRGRPKKVVSVNTEAPKKKRGRPPKSTSAPLASNEAVAKKRGRPKKVVSENTEAPKKKRDDRLNLHPHHLLLTGPSLKKEDDPKRW